MSSIPRQQPNGGPLAVEPRRGGRSSPPRRLYEYRPVRPFGVDEDGYLCEDSVGQNADHIALFAYALALKRRYRGRAVVGSDLFLHYSKGHRRRAMAPDVFVAFGAEDRPHRKSYKLWEDPTPDFILEVLSEETWRNDLGIKKDTCEYLGVREYWLFDPIGRWMQPVLAGFRLRDGVYEPIRPDDDGHLTSEVLHLQLRMRDDELRFYDPLAGAYLRTYDEAEDRAEDAAQEIAALKAQLAAMQEQQAP